VNAKIIDGHSHLFQVAQPADKLKKSVKEIKDFDIKKTVATFDKLGIELVQTMPQEMTRIMGQWLGSNDLSVAIRDASPERFLAFAAAEPLTTEETFNHSSGTNARDLGEYNSP
jgi:hypothetical protein